MPLMNNVVIDIDKFYNITQIELLHVDGVIFKELQTVFKKGEEKNSFKFSGWSSTKINTLPYSGFSAKKLWFDDEKIYVELSDGRGLSVPLSFYPSLEKVGKNVLEDFRFYDDNKSIHFNKIQEDLSVDALVYGFRENQGSN